MVGKRTNLKTNGPKLGFFKKNLAPRVSAAKKKWLLHAKVEKTWPLYLISWPLHLMLTNATKMNYKWRCSRVHMWQAPTFFSGRGSAKTARSAAVLVQVDCDTMPRRVKKNHCLCCLGVYGSCLSCHAPRKKSGGFSDLLVHLPPGLSTQRAQDGDIWRKLCEMPPEPHDAEGR